MQRGRRSRRRSRSPVAIVVAVVAAAAVVGIALMMFGGREEAKKPTAERVAREEPKETAPADVSDAPAGPLASGSAGARLKAGETIEPAQTTGREEAVSRPEGRAAMETRDEPGAPVEKLPPSPPGKRAAGKYSWELAEARPTRTGDLEWKPKEFAFEAGDSVRYIDFEKGNDTNAGTGKTAAWKHHPWDANATGKAAA